MQYVLKQKLKWRSMRRSMLEADIYFSRFIEQGGFDGLTDTELLAYQDLIEFADGDLLLLFQGKEQADDGLLQSIVEKIKVCGVN